MSSPILEERAGDAATLVAVDGRTYPLRKADLLARAEGGVARTTLLQTFANPYDEALELAYTLPLPADGAVLGYTIRIGETVIRAEVKPREQADREYRDALFEGRTAGLLEQSRPDTFRQRLGNVPARTEVEIAIDVLHPLAFVFADGAGNARPATPSARAAADRPHWEYRFPTVVGVRYHGAPNRVPDAAAVSPDCGDVPARVSLALTIADPVRDAIHSPSHAIDAGDAEGHASVSFREGERLDRDVVVRWLAGAAEPSVHVVEGSGLEGDDGRYALVTIVPDEGGGEHLCRDLTVLLDASGSMGGEPLVLAKQVVGDLLASLEKGDRFELIAFSDQPRQLTRGLIAMDLGVEPSVRDALAKVQANGGTEMVSALKTALRPSRKGAQHQVVLVTDGDVSFETEVVAEVAGRENVRLHVVGVGACPNRALTQQAAAAGRGLELLVGDASAAASAAKRLVAGTARPVLTGVSVGGSAVVGERQEWLRDVFAGQPLLVTVELAREGGTLELRGELAGSREPWIERIDVPAHGAHARLPRSPLPLGALHGRAVAAELELRRARLDGDDARMADRSIEAIGMRHRIATRRTSLVAIAETPSVDRKQPSRRVELAVELPAGVSAEAVGLTRMSAPGGWIGMELPQMLRRTGPGTVFEDSEDGPAVHCDVSIDAVFKGAGAPRRAALPAKAAPTREVLITPTDVRWLGPDTIVLEFITSRDGFLVPRGRARLHVIPDIGGEKVVLGTCVESESSPEGPHPAGRVVRLAIRIGEERRWSGPAHVTAAAPSDQDRREATRWKFEFRLPDRPEAGAR